MRDSAILNGNTPGARPRTILILASGFIYRPTSSNNLGDRAQLANNLERLGAAFPEAKLVAFANSLNDDAELDSLDVRYSAIEYLTSSIRIPILGSRLPNGLARALRGIVLMANVGRAKRAKKTALLSPAGRSAVRVMMESDALFISGAGGFNDRYITGVGGFWCLIAICMKLLEKPVVASGQQIGPLKRTGRRALARWAFRSFDLIGVRDPESLSIAAGLSVPPERLVLTGDDAWDLAPVSDDDVSRVLTRLGIPEPFIACQIRFGPSVGWTEADAPGLAKSLTGLAIEWGLPVVFVPCMTGDGADDRFAAERVKQHMSVQSWIVRDELDAPTTKALLGRATIAVGTANHLAVFAASAGTSVIALYGSPYMEQKLLGLANLWPASIEALPKASALKPDSIIAASRRLVGGISDDAVAAGGVDPNGIMSDASIRALSHLLREPQVSTYSSRFSNLRSVEEYEHGFSHPYMATSSELERRTLRRALVATGRTPFTHHLDFACGSGRAVGFVEGLAIQSIGVDISEEMLTVARQRFPDVKFMTVDASADPAPVVAQGPFDLVTMWRFLAPAEPHLRHSALQVVEKAMDHDGYLVINNNANRRSLHVVALMVRSLLRGQPLRTSVEYQRSLSNADLRRLLQSVGLRVEAIFGVGYLPDQLKIRLPEWLWKPPEVLLNKLNLVPQLAVNQVILARKADRRHSDVIVRS